MQKYPQAMNIGCTVIVQTVWKGFNKSKVNKEDSYIGHSTRGLMCAGDDVDGLEWGGGCECGLLKHAVERIQVIGPVFVFFARADGLL